MSIKSASLLREKYFLAVHARPIQTRYTFFLSSKVQTDEVSCWPHLTVQNASKKFERSKQPRYFFAYGCAKKSLRHMLMSRHAKKHHQI